MKHLPFLLAVALAASCGSARRSETIVGPMNLARSELEDGALVFMEFCYKCHPGGEAGLGPALNNKPLPRFLVRLQVRKGLGAMPSFSDRQISDESLDDLLTYVTALWKH